MANFSQQTADSGFRRKLYVLTVHSKGSGTNFSLLDVLSTVRKMQQTLLQKIGNRR